MNWQWDKNTFLPLGANAKMNEFSAAMGICNLRHIEQEIEKRKHIDHRYKSHLEGVKGIKLRQEDPNVLYNYAYFPAVFESEFGATRNEVFDALAQEGIEARKYFYPIANSLECYRRRFDVSETFNMSQVTNSHGSRKFIHFSICADIQNRLRTVDAKIFQVFETFPQFRLSITNGAPLYRMKYFCSMNASGNEAARRSYYDAIYICLYNACDRP